MMKHSVIADSMILVVLDGMRRMEAARAAGLDGMIMCEVDYANSKVKVFRWFRVAKGPEDLAGKLLSGPEFSRVEREEAMDLLDRKEVASAVFVNGAAYVSRRDVKSSMTSSRMAQEMERDTSLGFEVSYGSETDALALLDLGGAIFVVAHQPVNKWDVLKAALSGELFVHKSTCHVVLARPLFVNASVDLLSPATPLEDAVSALAKRLESANYTVLPPGSRVGSRKYQEVVYVFGEPP